MTACVVRCFGCQNNLVPENTLKKGGYRTSEKKTQRFVGGFVSQAASFHGKNLCDRIWSWHLWSNAEKVFEMSGDPWWTCRAALDVYTLGYFPFQVIVTTGSTTCLVGASFVTITEKRYNPIHLKKSKFEARTVTRATMYNRTRNLKKHRTLPKTRKLT